MASAAVDNPYRAPINTTGNWGRKGSYGALCEIRSENFSDRPLASQKGHLHFGTGADAYPRGAPRQQYYDITRLHRSHVRPHDETVPGANHVDCAQFMGEPTPGDPLASHQSQQALFPDHRDWKANEGAKYRNPSPLHRSTFSDDVSPREVSAAKVRYLKPERPDTTAVLSPRYHTQLAPGHDGDERPATETNVGDIATVASTFKLPVIAPSRTQVVKKCMGNFARVEVLNPTLPALCEGALRGDEDDDDEESYHDDLTKGKDLNFSSVHERDYEVDGIFPRKKYMTDFFSRHDALTSFRQRHPGSTPIKERYWGKKPADWHLSVGPRSLGR